MFSNWKNKFRDFLSKFGPVEEEDIENEQISNNFTEQFKQINFGCYLRNLIEKKNNREKFYNHDNKTLEKMASISKIFTSELTTT